MSEIRATTISNAAGTGPVALYKQSAAKAWSKITYSAGTPTSGGNSLNISSLTDYSTGTINVNFSANFDSTDYAFFGCSWSDRIGLVARNSDQPYSSSSFGFSIQDSRNAAYSDWNPTASFLGDLA